MHWIIKILVNGLAVFLAAQWIPGIHVKGIGTAIFAALILAIINLVIRPLILFFTLPINILTLGLFSLVINAALFWLTGFLLQGQGFVVDGFIPAFFGALLVTIFSWILNLFD